MTNSRSDAPRHRGEAAGAAEIAAGGGSRPRRPAPLEPLTAMWHDFAMVHREGDLAVDDDESWLERLEALRARIATMPAATLDGVIVKLDLLAHQEAGGEGGYEAELVRTSLEALRRFAWRVRS